MSRLTIQTSSNAVGFHEILVKQVGITAILPPRKMYQAIKILCGMYS